ncbi:MAG TPA: type III-B CRISPR module RAMP protein Cmr4 [Smithellaceae bacterium]|nr:type III-B CRISPR module RAMP protein Cmr4 [Smithellaceae bacterium]
MFTEQTIFFYYTETPLHAGSGSSVAYVDLPIQREKHTEYPILQASGVKGAFRSWATALYKDDKPKKAEINKAFGPEDKADEHSGALSFTDAQVLLFPVRSYRGGFAWITCPQVLSRFARMVKTAGIAPQGIENLPTAVADDTDAKVSANSALIVNTGDAARVILEDFAFEPDKSEDNLITQFAGWLADHAIARDNQFQYIRAALLKRLVVLSDNRFRDFVTLSTDIQTRINIDSDTGTVKTGALWNEEMLLPDTLLYNLVLGKSMQYRGKDNDGEKSAHSSYSAAAAVSFACGIVDKAGLLQMGGDETLGRGLVRVRHLPKTN